MTAPMKNMDIAQELMENKLRHMDNDLKTVSRQLQLLQEFIKCTFGQDFTNFVSTQPSRLLQTERGRAVSEVQDPIESPNLVGVGVASSTVTNEACLQVEEIEIKEEVPPSFLIEVYTGKDDGGNAVVIEDNFNNVESESAEYRVLDFGQSDNMDLGEIGDSNYVELQMQQPKLEEGDNGVIDMVEEDIDPFNIFIEPPHPTEDQLVVAHIFEDTGLRKRKSVRGPRIIGAYSETSTSKSANIGLLPVFKARARAAAATVVPVKPSRRPAVYKTKKKKWSVNDESQCPVCKKECGTRRALTRHQIYYRSRVHKAPKFQQTPTPRNVRSDVKGRKASTRVRGD